MNSLLKHSLTLLLIILPMISMSQWINEIHYDNSSTDSNEGIEVAGLAGTNLSCYDLVLYNGSNNLMYNTINLSGIIPDEGCGYGAIWFAYPGLQNGSPDGIALVSNCSGTTVIQFLTYEGIITAGDGPANGMTSTDIGVAESGTTPVGQSLQLTGTGSQYSDFSWNAPSASSQGSLNTGQTISPCGSNTITTGVVSGAPFDVDCSGPTTDAGTVDFTSVGTFNAGNTYTAQLSDASGSFASPTDIGTLVSAANSGTINITIPSGVASGTGYLIRVVADNPATTGSASAAFTINQNGSCAPSLPSSQGLLINEFSNGPSGSKEYYEFVVAGQCGDIVDITGYILDDNNGTFSVTFPSSSGIAPGHLRLTNHAQWQAIPVGSLIVIYNDDDVNLALPADDPFDSNNDSLYVIPHNNAALFEITGTLPDNNVPDSTYAPVTYGSVSWSPLGLRNSGDAIQVRAPNGAYWHGVSYGNTSEMTGGPNNMMISTSGMGGQCGWFTDGDFLDPINWSTGSVLVPGNQTPGLPNNPLNYAWLQMMRDPAAPNCPVTTLPVEITYFNGWNNEHGNLIVWQSYSEVNSDYFIIERSTDGKHWEEIHRETAAGNSTTALDYSFVDVRYTSTVNYYRLTKVDLDGSSSLHEKFVAIDNTESSEIHLIKIINLMGQEIDANTSGVQIYVYSDGSSIKHFKD